MAGPSGGVDVAGAVPEARIAVTNALALHRRSVGLWWQAREVFRSVGDLETADQALDQIGYLVNTWPERYQDTPNRVLIGRAALAQGADPKLVFDGSINPPGRRIPRIGRCISPVENWRWIKMILPWRPSGFVTA